MSKYDDDDEDYNDYKNDNYEEKEEKYEYKINKKNKEEEEKEERKKLNEDELINKVQKYFYEDNEFTKVFENFILEESSIIDLSSNEYKLEYTEAYERYKLLFEEKLENYIESIHSTPLEFYKALKNKTDNDPDSSYALFGQILVSVIDFDIFMVMMREMAQSNQRKNRK